MPTSALTEETARFFRAPIYPVVTTILPDGSPQSSVVWSRVEDGRVVFSTIRGRRKTRNLERDPRVTLIAHDPQDPYSYVEVRGTVTFEDDAAAALIDDLSRDYDGKPWTRRPDEERVVVRVTPTTVVAHVAPQSRGANAVAAQGGPVRQLRLVVHAEDYEEAVRFYRDVLGMIDVDEVGRRVAPRFRLALEVEDTDTAAAAAAAGGARTLAPPTRTPWDSLNARLETPGGVQLTLFQELG